MATVQMVAFKTHIRGDALIKPGDEFEVSEEESHAYLARKNPLAGPLDGTEVKPVVKPAVKKVATPAAAPAKPRARSRKKAK